MCIYLYAGCNNRETGYYINETCEDTVKFKTQRVSYFGNEIVEFRKVDELFWFFLSFSVFAWIPRRSDGVVNHCGCITHRVKSTFKQDALFDLWSVRSWDTCIVETFERKDKTDRGINEPYRYVQYTWSAGPPTVAPEAGGYTEVERDSVSVPHP